MQGKIKILESDNEGVVKSKRVFDDVNIHFSGSNTHRLTIKSKRETEYTFEIDFVTIEANSLLLDGELSNSDYAYTKEQSDVSYISLRFTPFLKKF